MSVEEDNDLLKKLAEMRSHLQEKFVFIDSTDDLPEQWSGSGILHIDVNPDLAFHFLEFIFDVAYVDILKSAGFNFIDDKTTWEYFVMSEHGFLRIYDWKGYTVSVGSFGELGLTVSDGIKEDAEYFKKLIEDNIGRFIEYRQAEYKKHLDEYPFDNFMDAFISLNLLFRDAIENINETKDYLEALILLVALLDTQLRYAILLTRINTRKTKKIDSDFWILFQQKEGGEYLTERNVFRLAKEEVAFNEYDKELFFERINTLYDTRNRAVHRFAITNFQYSASKLAVDEYRDLVDVLQKIIEDLECEQVRLSVGFVKKDELTLPAEQLRKEIVRAVGGKIDSKALLPRTEERQAMFSDNYPDGYHPSLERIISEFKRKSETKSVD